MSTTPTPPVLLYDGDCAFCTRVITSVRRRVRPPVRFLPWQQVNLDDHGATEADVLAAVLWVGPDGHRRGAQAFGAVLRAAGGWWWPVGAVVLLPGVRQLAALAYRLIAVNRHRLPGGSAACELRSP